MRPATTTRPRRLRADAARNQQRIIAAAHELFAARGLDITLDTVAEHAGVGVGTVYRRFANKKELISEVFQQYLDQIAETADTYCHHPNPWQGLVEFFEYACTLLATNRGLSDVLLELHDDPEQFTRVRELIKPRVAHIIHRAKQVGAVRPEIEASDFFAIVHMVDNLAAFTNPVSSEVWRRYLAITLNGIRCDQIPRQPLVVSPLTDEQVDQAKSINGCPAQRR